LVFDKPNDVVARLCDWRTRRMRMARDLGSECGVENRMSETASVIRPAMGIASGPCFNALRCDFDDVSSCRINRGERGCSQHRPGVGGRGILYGSGRRLKTVDSSGADEAAMSA
jgi:hypothetical protein